MLSVVVYVSLVTYSAKRQVSYPLASVLRTSVVIGMPHSKPGTYVDREFMVTSTVLVIHEKEHYKRPKSLGTASIGKRTNDTRDLLNILTIMNSSGGRWEVALISGYAIVEY